MTRWGYGEELMRLPGALAGSVAVVLGYLLAARSGIPLAGFLTAGLLAFLPVLVTGARTLSPEPWAALFTTVALYGWVSGLAGLRTHKTARWTPWCLVAMGLVGLGCVGLTAFVLWLPVLATSLGSSHGRQRWRMILPLGACGAILVAIWTVTQPRLLPLLVVAPLDARVILSLGDSLPLPLGTILAALAAWGVWRAYDSLAVRLALLCSMAALLPIAASQWHGCQIEAAELAVLYTSIAVLAGHGAAALLASPGSTSATASRSLAADRSRWAAASVVALLLLMGPSLQRQLQRPALPWRAVAQLLRDNLAADERVTVMLERDSLAFYAPDLEARIDPMQPPGRALAYLPGRERVWLIVPEVVDLYPAGGRVATLVEQFRAVDLSPDPRLRVYYYSRKGTPATLDRVSSFRLPLATLARNNLLLQLVQREQTTAAVLWKVDQLVLGEPLTELRNPSLIAAALLLVRQNHADRAGSLAYRLATALPEWPEASALLRAFRP